MTEKAAFTRAYDMSKYQRLVGVDGRLISGTFAVSMPLGEDRAAWVKTHDVVIWDEGHHSGRCLYSNDLTGSVKDGVASLSKHMVAERIRPDVEDVWDDMLAVLVAVVEAAQRGPSE